MGDVNVAYHFPMAMIMHFTTRLMNKRNTSLAEIFPHLLTPALSALLESCAELFAINEGRSVPSYRPGSRDARLHSSPAHVAAA